MKKQIESRILFLISAISYCIGVGLLNSGYEVIASGLDIIGIITLLIGIIRFIGEKKIEKKTE